MSTLLLIFCIKYFHKSPLRSLYLLKGLPASFIFPSFDRSSSFVCSCFMLCDKHFVRTIRVQSSYTKHCVIGCRSNYCQDYHRSLCILVFLFGESHLVFQLCMRRKLLALGLHQFILKNLISFATDI